MPLINCKIHIKLNWTKNCVMSDIAGDTTSTEDNIKLTKQLNKGFKIPV